MIKSNGRRRREKVQLVIKIIDDKNVDDWSNVPEGFSKPTVERKIDGDYHQLVTIGKVEKRSIYLNGDGPVGEDIQATRKEDRQNKETIIDLLLPIKSESEVNADDDWLIGSSVMEMTNEEMSLDELSDNEIVEIVKEGTLVKERQDGKKEIYLNPTSITLSSPMKSVGYKKIQFFETVEDAISWIESTNSSFDGIESDQLLEYLQLNIAIFFDIPNTSIKGSIWINPKRLK